MKLQKRLTIEGKEHPIVSESIRLNLDRPGLGIFQVQAGEPLAGLVEFAMGWHFDARLTLFFTGEIKTSTPVDAAQQRLLCNEFSARLDAAAPLSLRHPTLKDVLGGYTKLSGVEFLIPPKPYANTKVPAFYGFGSAYQAMHNLGGVFHIPDYVWLTQADGRVFVGSWEDSRWKDKEIAIPREMFSDITADGARTMTAAPGIRPGCVLNGERVETVIFSGHTMSITCKNA